MSVQTRNQQTTLIPVQRDASIVCPHCGSEARLTGTMPAGQGTEQRTFECKTCKQQKNVIVKV